MQRVTAESFSDIATIDFTSRNQLPPFFFRLRLSAGSRVPIGPHVDGLLNSWQASPHPRRDSSFRFSFYR